MNPIEHDRKVRRFIQQRLKVFDCFLFREIKPELVLDLFVHITVFDVGYVGVDHESDEIQNEIGALTQDGECCETKIFETCIMRGLRATHPVDHLLTNLYGRREGLWVATQDIAKVNCRYALAAYYEKIHG